MSPSNANQNRRRDSSPGELPWHVKSFLRQKVYSKDEDTLAKVKQVMAVRRPRKPKVSCYNQQTMRQ